MAETYRSFTRSRAHVQFSSWEEGLEPSLLQAVLSPRGEAVRGWRSRLILCGSALSTMRNLLGGTAPLRGWASLELVIHPFGYRDAAAFWQVASDPQLAMRLHAIVGGTPAYVDMCNAPGPRSSDELDAWVVRALLDPASAMFREGNVLLAEEEQVVDTSVYFAVLTAISQGQTRRGEIAGAIGKAEGTLAHPLTALTEARLVAPLGDAMKQKRTTFHVAEPLLRLHQLVIASTASIGGTAGDVGPTRVACREHRCNHEVDVVVTQVKANSRDRIVAIGEAKWRTDACGVDQLTRLEHMRALLKLPLSVKLLLCSGAGFTYTLISAADSRPDVELVDVARLYQGT